MRRVVLLGVAAMVAVATYAQRVVVSKSADGKITISFASFRAASDAISQEFYQTLTADLNRSGYFKVTSSGAELNVVGSAAAGGGGIRTEVQVFKTGTKQRLLGKSYQTTTQEVRTLAHKVADEILLAVTGKKGMASAKIAVVSNRSGKKELYLCDMDGQNMRQITNDRSIVMGPRWSADGTRIVFTSYLRGFPGIYMANLATGKRDRLASYGGLNASGALSPDGRSMAMILSVEGNPELYIKDLRSGKLRRLTYTTKANEASPSWSPDGKQIAFVSDMSGKPQVYVISSSGGTAQRLTTTGTENVSPDWGPNGIAFCTRVGGKYKIAVADPAARTLMVLDTDWADYEDPSWAPDGRHIICSRTANHRSSIYLLDTLKDSPVALISSTADWFSPACSR